MTDLEQAYQSALDFLYSHVDFSLTRNPHFNPEVFHLDRMVQALEALGNPQRRFAVAHVAGTKGKGSVAAMTESILRAAGYRTGFYLSPHLHDYTERVQINGEAISHAELVERVERDLKPLAEKIPGLTTFELTTLLAFTAFADHGVEVAVIEVGLGGRLDATNVVEPAVSVITSLSMDHTAILGDTLEKIAFEKAGIIKPRRPVVSSQQKPEAMAVLRRIAGERSAPLAVVGEDFLFEPLAHSLDNQQLRLTTPAGEPDEEFTIPLLGAHQVQNAATAWGAVMTLRQQGYTISDEAVRIGFESVKWPGRFEILQRNPFVVVDSAHNRDSAAKLAATLRDYFGDRPATLVIGVSEDKDIQGILAELVPAAKRVVATQSIHPRALEAAALAEKVKEFGNAVEAIIPLELAVERAIEWAQDEDGVALAAGSLFIAAAVREVWQQRFERRGVDNS